MENRSMKKRTFSTAATNSPLPKISSSSRHNLSRVLKHNCYKLIHLCSCQSINIKEDWQSDDYYF